VIEGRKGGVKLTVSAGGGPGGLVGERHGRNLGRYKRSPESDD